MAEKNKVVLYNRWISSSSWRVRIALKLKDIDYEYVSVGIQEGQQHSPEYRRLNPMGFIPTLVVDGAVLNQSLPIIEYLEEIKPEPPLFPKDGIGRAKVRALAEIVNSGIQPFQTPKTLLKMGEQGEDVARYFITTGFDAMEAMLKETAGKYSYGDQITVADLFMVPQVFRAETFLMDLNRWPTVKRVYEELNKLPAFIASHATNQVDTPDGVDIGNMR